MNIEVFYNTDFPMIMTARGPGGYPMVHAVLENEIEPTRLVLRFVELWWPDRGNTQEDVKKVRDELLKDLYELYGQHNLVYKIDGKYYKLSKGLLNKYGITLIAVED